MEQREQSVLRGSVESIGFQDHDRGFAVIEILSEGNGVTAVGDLAYLHVGEEVELYGRYVNHPQFGPQFQVEYYTVSLPETESAVYQYLASGAIRGIGPVIARRIVERFGKEALSIIAETPGLLSEIKGISKEKAREVGKAFEDAFSLGTLMSMLTQYGLPPHVAARAYARWGRLALEQIEEDPFLLCSADIGVPFETADAISQQMGKEPVFGGRIRAAVTYILLHNTQNGHTCAPEEKVLETAQRLLSISVEEISRFLPAAAEQGDIVRKSMEGRNFLYLPDLFYAEQNIAIRCGNFKRYFLDNGQDYTQKIRHVESEMGITLSAQQREAVGKALTNGLTVITGGAGTGKTTVLSAVIRLFAEEEMKVVVCAPTGRAAKRIGELCGVQAKTIHRLLEAKFREGARSASFSRNERNPLDCDVVIVDEMSMVDVTLFDALLRAMPLSCRMVLVGDDNQLPSVGPGNVLRNIIESGCAVTIQLREIFRQAAQSLIVRNAHRVIAGQLPDLQRRDQDFFFVESRDEPWILEYVSQLISSRLPARYGFDPMWSIQLIAPGRNGLLGVSSCNTVLQRVLNPPAAQKSEISAGGIIYREGDKVIQIKNNYEQVLLKEDGSQTSGVFNGDLGSILRIDRRTQTVFLQFDQGVSEYSFEQLGELELAYAMTVHKSQGSEFECVILPLSSHRSRLYYRNLLYTAVTRAKKMLIILGSGETIRYMVENNRRFLRYTNLLPMIREQLL